MSLNPSASVKPAAKSASPYGDLFKVLPFLPGQTQEVLEILQLHGTAITKSSGEVITQQGDDINAIYILYQGEVRITRKVEDASGASRTVIDKRVKIDQASVTVTPRGTERSLIIGIDALIYGSEYTADVVTQSNCQFYKTSATNWERLLYRFPSLRQDLVQQRFIHRLRTFPSLRGVDLITLSYLADELLEEKYTPPPGATLPIYPDARQAETFYLIHQGQVKLYSPRTPQKVSWLGGTGCAFGFPMATGSRRYGYWAEATTETTLYTLSWETIELIATCYPHVKDPDVQRVPLRTLQQVSVFERLTAQERKILSGYCSFQYIPQHHLIMFQGDVDDSMWILLAGGRAQLMPLDEKNQPLPYVPVEGIAYFGESSLLARHTVSSSVAAEPGSLWLRLYWEDFERFLQLEVKDRAEFLERLNIPHSAVHTPIIENEHQRYPWLEAEEHVIVAERRHIVALLPALRWAYIGLGISLLLGIPLIFLGVPLPWLTSILLFLTLPGAVWGVTDYLNDFLVITNQRVVQQEKVILIREFRREAFLEQVQSVTIQHTFWGNILGYGTIIIYTAGSSGSIIFNLAPNPDNLRTAIFQEKGLLKSLSQARNKLEIQNALEQKLRLVIELPSRVRMYTTATDTDAQSQWRLLSWRRKIDWSEIDHVVWRKHPFALIVRIWWLLLLFFLVVAMIVGGLGLVSLPGIDLRLITFIEFILVVVALGLAGYIIWQIADWYNDTYELTRDRIIDVDKLPLFLSEERREAQLKDIQDVQLVISSPLQVILDYGDIIVQTAAATGAFTFDHVAHPREVQAEINRRRMAWRYEDERRRNRERFADLPEWFELYKRLETKSTLPGMDENGQPFPPEEDGY
jgi:CRP-like cAMP-binding protein